MSRRRPGSRIHPASATAEARPGFSAPWLTPPLILLAIAAFLAPILGGRLSVEPMPLLPGFGAVLVSLWDGSEAATLGHALIACCIAAAAIIALRRSTVLQTPVTRHAAPMAVLVLAIFVPLLLTPFRWQSLGAVSEWLIYIAAYCATIAIAGRSKGPALLMGAIVAGCFVIAAVGIRDYWQMRALDPSWRIFGNWTNPNALAGMLVFGLFMSIGLGLSKERLTALAACGAAVVIGFALVLTQSKGGLLATGAGGLALLIALVGWLKPSGYRLPALRLLAIAGSLTLMILLLRASPGAAAGTAEGPTPFARVSNSGSTSEQSEGFRKLLWQSSIDIAKENPMGSGLGTFRYFSAKPGLTVQTHLAHQSYLQLASEAGPFALLALLAFGVVWLVDCFRGARSLPEGRNLLRAGCVGAFVAAAAHSGIDSDLYFFGSGLALFMTMGIGALLAADALTPEPVRAPGRALLAGLSGVAAVFLLYAGWVELAKCRIFGDLALGDASGATAGVENLKSLAMTDGESWFQISRLETGRDRMAALENAASNAPSPKVYRALARLLAEEGKSTEAQAALSQALFWDPNNLSALELRWQLYRQADDIDRAKEAAWKLVEVESKDYYRVRALPEIQPTETLRARAFLAETNPASQSVALLEPALEGYKKLLGSTLPFVLPFLKESPYGQMAGVSAEDLREGFEEGKRIARILQEAYRSEGDSGKAEEAGSWIGKFDEGLDALDSLAR